MVDGCLSFKDHIAFVSYVILPPNKPNFITNVDSRIDEELLRKINKDCDPKGIYFEISIFYLENYRY